MRHLVPAVFALTFAACFNAVPEAQCLKDSDCDAGTCVDNKCTTGGLGGGTAGGGIGGGMTGGGTGAGTTGGGTTGGGTTGGGTTGGGTGGGMTGGGTTGGGTGGGGMVCGCIDPTGQCRVGDSPLACGANRGMCQTCGFGEQCVNGACQMGACGPMSCSGCCTNNFCVTVGQQTRFACGNNGAMCTQCGMGQACVNGSCQTPTCDAMSCPTGCCQNGQCQTGNSRFACGSGGQTCVRCGMGVQCNNNMCGGGVIDGGIPTMDAGALVPAGTACTDTQQCQPPFQAFCIAESIAGQPTGYTGGYCTEQCGMNDPCTGGAVCITESFFGASQSTCRAPCMNPGTQSSCRTGYVCQPSTLSSVPGFCRARCNNMGALSGCPQGQMCNAMTGVCN
ncbi:MAG: hypothetical protein JNM17_08740 [Archangium sp.]|nr:hypothetical protein [Archangium sp.]